MLVEADGAPVETYKPRFRAAGRTGDSFCVEPSVRRVVILAEASVAHDKGGHRCPGAVIRDTLDDAEARPAMSTVREGVAITALERIEYLLCAGRAGCGIRGDLRARSTTDRLGDAKSTYRHFGNGSALNLLDPRKWRRLSPQALDQKGNRVAIPRDTNHHALRIIQYFARKPQLLGETPNRRPETHALHAASHANLDTDRLLPRFGVGMQVHAVSHRRTRLLPESATTRVLSRAATA